MAAAASARRRPAQGRPRGLRPGLDLRAGMAVGLYGGSFNPVHSGHVHVAEVALRRLNLDRVVWLVSPQNPLKASADTADLDARLAAVRRRAPSRRMLVSDIERRIGTRYTIDTVRWLKSRFPGVRFVWIMGADSLAGFHRWKGWSDLAREVPIAVVSRPGIALRSRFSRLARRFAAFRRPAGSGAILARQAPPAWIYLTAPFKAVSSTALRKSGLTGTADRAMGGIDDPRSRSIR
jgi:nicotinate-nucleotide adenylyltransferase